MNDFVLLPNESQRQALCTMMYQAFVEIRALGWVGSAEQASDLADAFHNLPQEMYGWGHWDVQVFRQMLLKYQKKYAGHDERSGNHDYVAMLDRIFPSRDIDHIIAGVKHQLPMVEVQQHWVKTPGTEDDGIWWFRLPGVAKDIQIESTYGRCPFLVEHDDMKSTSEAETAQSIEQAVEKIVCYLSGLQGRRR